MKSFGHQTVAYITSRVSRVSRVTRVTHLDEEAGGVARRTRTRVTSRRLFVYIGQSAPAPTAARARAWGSMLAKSVSIVR